MGKHRKPKPEGGINLSRAGLGVVLGAALAAAWLNQPTSAAGPGMQPSIVTVPHARTDYRTAIPKTAVVPVKKVHHRVPPLVGAAGLTGNASALAEYIRVSYPAVKLLSGVRADPFPDHPSGHAVDVMVYGDTATGNAILTDVMAQSQRLRIRYAIWQQKIYHPGRAGRWMPDRGGPTQNHWDHVHLTVW